MGWQLELRSSFRSGVLTCGLSLVHARRLSWFTAREEVPVIEQCYIRCGGAWTGVSFRAQFGSAIRYPAEEYNFHIGLRLVRTCR